MTTITERTIRANGIDLHLYEAGEGPVVLFVHGFPELGYSWRHQLRALAEAGFRAIAPDMRGYGSTSRPEDIEAYRIDHLITDLHAILDDVGVERALWVGHDWGAGVVWSAALRNPERMVALANLSIPFWNLGAGSRPPLERMRKIFTDDDQFYILHFQEPGKAEAILDRNAGDAIERVMYGVSGEGMVKASFGGDLTDGAFLSMLPEGRPSYMTDEEIAVFRQAFEATGFRGGINWYRNIEADWELMKPFADVVIEMPCAFIQGQYDVGTMFAAMNPGGSKGDRPDQTPDMRLEATVEGAGHWLHQERPTEVNDLLVGYITSVHDELGDWS